MVQCAAVGQEKQLVSRLPTWSPAFEKSTNTDYSSNEREQLRFLGAHLCVSICSGPPREIVLRFAVKAAGKSASSMPL